MNIPEEPVYRFVLFLTLKKILWKPQKIIIIPAVTAVVLEMDGR
jgi:hypothetical protein